MCVFLFLFLTFLERRRILMALPGVISLPGCGLKLNGDFVLPLDQLSGSTCPFR
jgi:hypothetical protein